MNVILFGNMVFAGVIKLRKGHMGSEWVLNRMPRVLIRRGNFRQRDTKDRHTGRRPVKV